MKNTCVNEYGKEINYAVAENLMDDDLREEIHRELIKGDIFYLSFLIYFNVYALKR